MIQPGDTELAFASGILAGLLLALLLRLVWQTARRLLRARAWRLRLIKPMRPEDE